jgi:hypothetical protein
VFFVVRLQRPAREHGNAKDVRYRLRVPLLRYGERSVAD